MLQLRHLAFASSVALMMATPAAHAAAMPLPLPYKPTITVVDRLANPVPSQDVGPGDDQSAQPDEVAPDDLPPTDEILPPDVNDENNTDMMQPDEMPRDGGDAPRPPAVSNDNDNGQLPQDQDDGN
ncbi:hypothetical protein [Mesorhizobium shangrilense]|uniref:Secreted protein n=1 Tax=Mesorhizobium shangrilense TaxID=460060 RepID=A0ABV2D610_9HYPH